MDNVDKIKKKILKDIKDKKIIQIKTSKEFNELNKEECINVLKEIINQEENVNIKKQLIEIYEKSNYMNDKNLLLLAIWSSYSKNSN